MLARASMSALTKTTGWIAGGLVAVILGIVIFIALAFLGVSSANGACLPPKGAIESGEVKVGSGPASDAYFARTPEQGVVAQKQANAAIIISVGRELGLSDYSVAIGVATAIQESGLVNLTYGDRDSLGLFQQRPSVKSWGTAEEIMDPYHAANAFFERLMTIPDRDQMPMMEAAILVQIPDRFYYERDWEWDEVATELVSGTPKDQSLCAGWVSPLEHGIANSDSYGMRQLSDDPKPRMHWGVDMPEAEGAEIRAASAGVVMFVGENGGYGNYVSIDHGNNISTGYAHMSRFADGIQKGDHVSAGQVIGYVGNTGYSFGDHLHFETVVDGEKVNPTEFMKERGVDLLTPGG